jgi:undecaprenyl diphosphate synthase
MEETKSNSSMCLNLCLSYGGRSDIVNSVRKIASDVKKELIKPEDIKEETISENLYTKGFPDPDILIRTSGEMRLSNFMMWQLSYSELFFTDTLWPDFTREEFLDIIRQFQTRDRRFGKV